MIKFTSLTTDRDGLYLRKTDHAVMVEIDEHGVTGAVYTELGITEEAAMPEDEIDFVFDRPFLFVVTGRDGSTSISSVYC